MDFVIIFEYMITDFRPKHVSMSLEFVIKSTQVYDWAPLKASQNQIKGARMQISF